MRIRRFNTCLPLATVFLLGVVCTSCVTTPRVEQGKERELLPAPDFSSLAGRRIAIDPGHGDPWPGAVAPNNGLKESLVNLAVARDLAAILESHGALPVLTRTTDAALAPDSLSADLAARVKIAEANSAEVFVSIHHNADIKPRSRRNDLEVYYKVFEDGPSLDLAQHMTLELARRYRVDAKGKRLLPGNYKVLRESSLPAVLIESSYMTNRPNARRLAKARTIHEEAAAIAAGLAAYFAADPPSVAGVSATAIDGARYHQVAWTLSRGYPLDMPTLQVLLGDQPIAGQVRINGAEVIWTSADTLPSGDYALTLTGRNLTGASLRTTATLSVDRPPAFLLVTQYPDPAQPGAPCQISVRVLDIFGQPVKDGTPVHIAQLDLTQSTQKGTALFEVVPDPARSTLDLSSGDIRSTHTIAFAKGATLLISVQDGLTKNPIPGAVITDALATLGVTNADGWSVVPSRLEALHIAATGYEPATITPDGTASSLQAPLTPLFDGVLRDQVIVIDADGGGRDANSIGPWGLRGSDANLTIAQYLAAYLREAGARPLLTRKGDNELSNQQRLQVANTPQAKLLISITAAADSAAARTLDNTGHQRAVTPPYVAHYPGSANGKALAQYIANRTGVNTIVPSVAYLVQQTRCPAVLFHLPLIEDTATEEKYRDIETCRRTAHDLFLALLDYFRARN